MAPSHQWDSVKYVADEPLYFSAPHTLDDIVCEGSDAEDGPAKTRSKRIRYEEAAQGVLHGHLPVILSAALKGPTSELSWTNPWRYRPAHKPDWWQPESDDMLFTRSNVLKWANDCGRGHLSPAEALAWCKAEAQAERSAIPRHGNGQREPWQLNGNTAKNSASRAATEEVVDDRSSRKISKHNTQSKHRTSQEFEDTCILSTELDDSISTFMGNETRSKKRPAKWQWIKSNVPKRARGESFSPSSTPTPVHKVPVGNSRSASCDISISTNAAQNNQSASVNHIRSENKLKPRRTGKISDSHGGRPTPKDFKSLPQHLPGQGTAKPEVPTKNRLSQRISGATSVPSSAIAAISDLDGTIIGLAGAQCQQEEPEPAAVTTEINMLRTPADQDSQASYVTEIAPSTKGIGTFRYRKRKQKDSWGPSPREPNVCIASGERQTPPQNCAAPDHQPEHDSEHANTSTLSGLRSIESKAPASSTPVQQELLQVESKTPLLIQDIKVSGCVLHTSEIESSDLINSPVSKFCQTPELRNSHVPTPRIPTPLGLDLSFGFGNFAQSYQNAAPASTNSPTSVSTPLDVNANARSHLGAKTSDNSTQAQGQHAAGRFKSSEMVFENFHDKTAFARTTSSKQIAPIASKICDHVNDGEVVAVPSVPTQPTRSVENGDSLGTWDLLDEVHITGAHAIVSPQSSRSPGITVLLDDDVSLDIENGISNDRGGEALMPASPNAGQSPLTIQNHSQERHGSSTSSKGSQMRNSSQPLPIKAYVCGKVERFTSTMQEPEGSQQLPKLPTARLANATLLRNLDPFECSTQSFDSAFATSPARKTPINTHQIADLSATEEEDEENDDKNSSVIPPRIERSSSDSRRRNRNLHANPNNQLSPLRHLTEAPASILHSGSHTRSLRSLRPSGSSQSPIPLQDRHSRCHSQMLDQPKTEKISSSLGPNLSMHGSRQCAFQHSCNTPRTITEDLDDDDASSILPSAQQTPFQAGSTSLQGLVPALIIANAGSGSPQDLNPQRSALDALQSPWGSIDKEQVTAVVPTAHIRGHPDLINDEGNNLHSVDRDIASCSWQKTDSPQGRNSASNGFDVLLYPQGQDENELKQTEKQSTQLLYDERSNPWKAKADASSWRDSKKRVSFGVLPTDGVESPSELLSKPTLRSPPAAKINYIFGGASDESDEDELDADHAVPGRPTSPPAKYKPVLSGSNYHLARSPFKRSSPPVAAMAEAFIAADREVSSEQECDVVSRSPDTFERHLKPIKEARMNHSAMESDGESARRSLYSRSPSRGPRTMSQEVAFNLDDMINEMDEFLGSWSVEADLQKESDKAAKDSNKSSNKRDRYSTISNDVWT